MKTAYSNITRHNKDSLLFLLVRSKPNQSRLGFTFCRACLYVSLQLPSFTSFPAPYKYLVSICPVFCDWLTALLFFVLIGQNSFPHWANHNGKKEQNRPIKTWSKNVYFMLQHTQVPRTQLTRQAPKKSHFLSSSLLRHLHLHCQLKACSLMSRHLPLGTKWRGLWEPFQLRVPYALTYAA